MSGTLHLGYLVTSASAGVEDLIDGSSNPCTRPVDPGSR